MSSAQARWLLLVGLSSVAFIACGGEDPPPSGASGSSSGGSSAGSQAGGSPATGGTSAGSTSGGSAGAATTAGTGGSSAGTGGAGGGTGGAGGSAGAAGAGGSVSGGGAGGGGAGGGDPSATAQIMGVNGMDVTGTVTFTQGATMTKMVLTLTECPDGARSSHLHVNNDCGNNAEAAGGHWPNGEMLGDYTCADGMVTHEAEKPIGLWTVGGDEATDVTKHAFMVHAMPDSQGSGDRIGCGTFPP